MKILEKDSNRNDGLFDVAQATEYLNIRKSTLYQMSMKKAIPVVKVGRLVRFRKIDLDAYVEKNLQKVNVSNELP